MSIVLVDGVRTPIGTFNGSLSKETPINLGVHVSKALIERTGVDPEAIDSSFFANVVLTQPRDLYTPRAVALESGLPQSSTALSVNRLCGSGIQAIISAAQHIKSGDGKISLVGGTEVMSKAIYSVRGMRSGQKMGPGVLDDFLTGALTDPMGNGIMGETAEKIAEKYGISRERQDEFALQSQQRARAAIAAGRFTEQIIPIGEFTQDEYPRETTLEKLGKLRPSFRREGGTVTPGNSSGINDAASALLLADEDVASRQSLTPRARVVSWGLAGVDPAYMGCGPIGAVPKALDNAGLKIDDIAWIESNEAFAAQAIAVSDQLGLDPERVNPDGGAIALGHPIGATGAILVTKLIHRLKDTGERYGLATMCIGGGQGIALIVEAL